VNALESMENEHTTSPGDYIHSTAIKSMTNPDQNSLSEEFISVSSTSNGPLTNQATTPTGEGTKEGPSSTVIYINNNNNNSVDEKDVPSRCGEADDDEEIVSILSDDIELNTFFVFPKRRRTRIICVVALVCLLIGSIALAGICGSGMCHRNINRSSNSTGEQTSFGVNGDDPCPSSAPTLKSQTETRIPTSSPIKHIYIKEPTTDDAADDSMDDTIVDPQLAFTTTQELYDAVDEYLMTGSTNNSYGTTIGTWNISLLTNLSNVFNAFDRSPLAQYFNENLTGWDTSRVTTMENLFLDARAFNGDVSTWQTGNVINMSETFGRATSFNGDVSKWDVSKVTTIYRMCKFCVTRFHITWLFSP
jgi:surface protein